MTTTLFVCTTCRAGQPIEDDAPAPGARLHAALSDQALPAGVRLQSVECLSACSNGCSIALSNPSAQGEIIQVFQRDAFELTPGMSVVFTDPSDGHDVSRDLAKVHAIVCNLPFVRFEDIAKVNPLVVACRERLVDALRTGQYARLAH